MTANKMPVLPKAAFRLIWKRGAYYVDKPEIGDTDVYTADQMRAMYLAGLEAAKACVPGLLDGGNVEYCAGSNGMRRLVLANLTALEQEAKR